MLGYELDTRVISPNNTLNLRLYLQKTTLTDTDYSLTAQVLPQDITDTTRWGAQDVALGTSQWREDRVQEIQLSIPLNPETPPTIYRLALGIYTQQPDGSFYNLPLVDGTRTTNQTLLDLTKIRVESK